MCPSFRNIVSELCAKFLNIETGPDLSLHQHLIELCEILHQCIIPLHLLSIKLVIHRFLHQIGGLFFFRVIIRTIRKLLYKEITLSSMTEDCLMFSVGMGEEAFCSPPWPVSSSPPRNIREGSSEEVSGQNTERAKR